MKRSSKLRFLAITAVLGLFIDCSGKYTVSGGAGAAPTGAGASPAGTGASPTGAGARGPGTSAGGGSSAVSAGGSDVVSVAGTTSVEFDGGSAQGGTFTSVTADAMAPLPSYCGVTIVPPISAAPVHFAAPDEVWRRVQSFLTGPGVQPLPNPNFPAVTTREWAGALADAALDSPDALNAGMARFVSSWLNGDEHEYPQTWTPFLVSRQSTLTDLFTPTQYLSMGSGVLTDPAILGHDISGRGVDVSSDFLCQLVPPPPPGIPPLPEPPTGVTRRQLLEEDVSQPSCAGCHRLIDPLGYALEHFDQVGNYRTIDNGRPIDSSGSYTLPSGTLITFSGVGDLGAQLAKSCDAALCFTQQVLTYAQTSAAVAPAGGSSQNEPELAQLAFSFSQSGLNLRTLLRAVVESDAFLRPSP